MAALHATASAPSILQRQPPSTLQREPPSTLQRQPPSTLQRQPPSTLQCQLNGTLRRQPARTLRRQPARTLQRQRPAPCSVSRPALAASVPNIIRHVRIVSSAPTRIDLAGGTIDIWPLYLFHDGALTLNAAISLRAHVELESRTDGRVELRSIDTDRMVSAARWEDLDAAGDLPLLAL